LLAREATALSQTTELRPVDLILCSQGGSTFSQETTLTGAPCTIACSSAALKVTCSFGSDKIDSPGSERCEFSAKRLAFSRGGSKLSSRRMHLLPVIHVDGFDYATYRNLHLINSPLWFKLPAGIASSILATHAQTRAVVDTPINTQTIARDQIGDCWRMTG